MAYFANGTEGTDYEQRWCTRCVHGEPRDGAGSCPVWFVHLLHNGHNGTVGAVLNELIPRDLSKPGSPNGQCRMFVEGEPPVPHQELPL